jgi:hypothetical protein
VTQVLLRCDRERHWLRAAPKLVGHLFPRLLAQSQYNTRLRQLAPLMEAALRRLADATPATAELLRLMDATPVPGGTSAVTAKRSDLFGYAGYGYGASHSRWYWGCKLLLICTCDGAVTGFSLANPRLHGERDQARRTLERQPANRPAPGTAVVTDEGLSGQGTEEFFAGDSPGLTLIRPARKDEKQRRPFPNWLRQRVEAVIWARIIQRLLALNACIWHNWQIGAPVKRSLIAYDHVRPARISRSTIQAQAFRSWAGTGDPFSSPRTVGSVAVSCFQASSAPAARQPCTTTSLPSALTRTSGMTGAIFSSSRVTAAAKPGAWPTPPPSTTRAGSTMVTTQHSTRATISASPATTAAARSSPAAAASKTRRAETWPRMPARRAARTTAGADAAASSGPRRRASPGSAPCPPEIGR